MLGKEESQRAGARNGGAFAEDSLSPDVQESAMIKHLVEEGDKRNR